MQYHVSKLKAEKYKTTNKIQRLKCFTSERQYGFKHGDLITNEHVLAVICYCDWSQSSHFSEFSNTFRQASTFETIQSIKSRNQQYAIWSRLLCQAVEIFGQDANYYEIRGPFYHGAKQQFVLSRMDILVYAPFSTTKSIGIATMFAMMGNGDDGMVMQLNNHSTFDHSRLKSFNCCWISGYPEEREYLYFGGGHKIRVEGIRMLQSANNYETYCRVLFYFACMFNGAAMNDDVEIPTGDGFILRQLITGRFQASSFFIPPEILDMFRVMIDQVTKITLNIHQLKSHFAKLWKSLTIIGNGDGQRRQSLFHTKPPLQHNYIMPNKSPLFDIKPKKPPLFDQCEQSFLFPNIKTIIIDFTESDNKTDVAECIEKDWKFDIKWLIDNIYDAQLFTKNDLEIILTATHKKGEQIGNKEIFEILSLKDLYKKDKQLYVEWKKNETNSKLKRDLVTIAGHKTGSVIDLLDELDQKPNEIDYRSKTEYVSLQPQTMSKMKQLLSNYQ